MSGWLYGCGCSSCRQARDEFKGDMLKALEPYIGMQNTTEIRDEIAEKLFQIARKHYGDDTR